MTLSFFVLLPLYIYPSPGAWQPLYDGITNHSDVNFKVIINPASGPGSSTYPDSNWQTELAYLNSFSNVETLGYTHCAYGYRDMEEIKADIDIYNGWAGYIGADIHVDGVWYDEAPTSPSCTSFMQGVTDYAEATLVHGATTILNPGTTPDTSYYDISSVSYINAYENTFNDDGCGTSTALRDIPADELGKSSAIIHDYAYTESVLASNVNAFVQANIAGLYITTESGYTTWSSNWSGFLDDVDAAIHPKTYC